MSVGFGASSSPRRTVAFWPVLGIVFLLGLLLVILLVARASRWIRTTVLPPSPSAVSAPVILEGTFVQGHGDPADRRSDPHVKPDHFFVLFLENDPTRGLRVHGDEEALRKIPSRATVRLQGEQTGREVVRAEILETRAPVSPLRSTPGPVKGTAAPPRVKGALAVPALSSLPGAPATLFLDFDGHVEPYWGWLENVTTPPFDQDGDETTFSAGELDAVRRIWEYVVEDYAPFNMNVTTVEPPDCCQNGQHLRVAVGGDGSWRGTGYGGVAVVDTFTNLVSNVVFVFSKNYGADIRAVAETVSHESGHGFGLEHQSTYDASGTKIDEYNTGTGVRAPIMGGSYGATRGLWWKGPNAICATCIQDDLAVIAKPQNVFGVRPDDYGDAADAATPLALGETPRPGLLTATTENDVFSFSADGGKVTASVVAPSPFQNVDTRLELRDASGVLLASAAPTDSFSAALTATVPAGTATLLVKSQGQYGDLGQYTVQVAVPPSPPPAPSTLTRSLLDSKSVKLSWADTSTTEESFELFRKILRLDGTVYQGSTLFATIPASTVTFTDTSVTPSYVYVYKVRARNSAGVSSFSNEVTARTIAAPVSLTGTSFTASTKLSWTDRSSNEAGFAIERKTGSTGTYAEIGRVGTNVISFTDSTSLPDTDYLYRVRAFNSAGFSSYTGEKLPIPATPSSLAATSPSGAPVEVKLTWQDRSGNETGFRIRRGPYVYPYPTSFTKIAEVGANTTTFTDTLSTGLTAGKTYEYQVLAVNSAGVVSPVSNTVRVVAR